MTIPHYQLAQKIADRFSQLPEVEAIALGGSVATGRANATSDLDVYVYPTSDIPADVRLSIGREFSKDAQVVDYWGPTVTWVDANTGIEVEALCFSVGWMEDLVLQPLERHQPKMGYTTSFWHTVKVSQVLFDRNGWFARLQQKANQPYPEELVRAIVDFNYPVLRDIYFSYRAQLDTAIQRGDLIVVNRNIEGFLASYFDILFALNRIPHPGVKRMLDIMEHECAKHPLKMREHVTQLIRSGSAASADTLQAVDHLVDGLDELLQPEGFI